MAQTPVFAVERRQGEDVVLLLWLGLRPHLEAQGLGLPARVTAIIRWPDKVLAGRSSDAIMSTLDVLPTFAALAGASLPDDRVIDGVNQCELIEGRPCWLAADGTKPSKFVP